MVTFMLSVTGDGKSVGCQRSLNFGIVEVDDCSVIFEHVHFFNAWDVVDGQFLERALELLVISGGCTVDNFLLPASSARAPDSDLRL